MTKTGPKKKGRSASGAGSSAAGAGGATSAVRAGAGSAGPAAAGGRPGEAAARLSLRVTPRSSRNEIVGWDDEGALRVKIKAPPVEGEANAELVAWLAKLLGVRKSAVRIVQGEGGRRKVVEIEGVSEAGLKAALARN